MKYVTANNQHYLMFIILQKHDCSWVFFYFKIEITGMIMGIIYGNYLKWELWIVGIM